MRTTSRSVTFRNTFVLKGIDSPLPPGLYEVETEEELIESASYLAYRRLATTLRVERGGTVQIHTIDPIDLEAALLRDAGLAG